jgi:uncharacterized membrane protein YedE/YeeE
MNSIQSNGDINPGHSHPGISKWISYGKFALAGIAFGIILTKGEVLSWFRIQEMFHLQSFHMFGTIGSAVLVGMISIWTIKKFKIKTLQGETIEIPAKKFSQGQIWGGLIFGMGWALTGACPGPMYAQIGMGVTVSAVMILSALLGTWVYGLLRDRLPH